MKRLSWVRSLPPRFAQCETNTEGLHHDSQGVSEWYSSVLAAGTDLERKPNNPRPMPGLPEIWFNATEDWITHNGPVPCRTWWELASGAPRVQG